MNLQPLLSTLACFAVFSIMVVLTMYLFTKLTKYNDWEEIKNRNTAAALSLGGKGIGVANIIHYAILSNNNPLDAIIWGVIGMTLQLAVYEVFVKIAPGGIDVGEEIRTGNNAVGFMSFALSVMFSFIVGTSIS